MPRRSRRTVTPQPVINFQPFVVRPRATPEDQAVVNLASAKLDTSHTTDCIKLYSQLFITVICAGVLIGVLVDAFQNNFDKESLYYLFGAGTLVCAMWEIRLGTYAFGAFFAYAVIGNPLIEILAKSCFGHGN